MLPLHVEKALVEEGEDISKKMRWTIALFKRQQNSNIKQSKFLDVNFDRKLTFLPHIKYLIGKCLKALNLLKVVSVTEWGVVRSSPFYRSLIRSKLDYGSIAYGSARK